MPGRERPGRSTPIRPTCRTAAPTPEATSKPAKEPNGSLSAKTGRHARPSAFRAAGPFEHEDGWYCRAWVEALNPSLRAETGANAVLDPYPRRSRPVEGRRRGLFGESGSVIGPARW